MRWQRILSLALFYTIEKRRLPPTNPKLGGFGKKLHLGHLLCSCNVGKEKDFISVAGEEKHFSSPLVGSWLRFPHNKRQINREKQTDV